MVLYMNTGDKRRKKKSEFTKRGENTISVLLRFILLKLSEPLVEKCNLESE